MYEFQINTIKCVVLYYFVKELSKLKYIIQFELNINCVIKNIIFVTLLPLLYLL